jgi:hypothetical protein
VNSALDIYADSTAHLLDELGYLDRLLRRAVVIARAARPRTDPDAFSGMVISEAELDRLMDTVTMAGETRPTDATIAELDETIATRRDAIRTRIAASRSNGVDLTLARVAEVCCLTEAEIDLLLVALAPELDTRYEIIYAYLQNDVTRKRPSVELALDLICRSTDEKFVARRFLSTGAPLLDRRVLTLGEEAYDRQPTLLRRFLKLDTSVLRFLLGQAPAPEPGFRAILPTETVPELSASAETAEALEALVQALQRFGTERSVVVLVGPSGALLEQAAITLGCALERPLFLIEPGWLGAERDNAAAVVRDAALWHALPVLTTAGAKNGETEQARPRTAEAMFWDQLRAAGLGAIVLCDTDERRRPPSDLRPWRIAVKGPGFAARRELWQATTRGGFPDADIDRLADLFTFGAEQVRQTAALAYTEAALRNPSDPMPNMADLMRAGRALASPNLRRFAVAVSPHYAWDDLVLPADRQQQLRSVAARIANRAIVQREWGFGEKQVRGRGVAVLFAGPPGTGKTMAAEILAGALSLDLFQIDLSTVVSKYIGETEKQLGTIFAEAEQGQCILFFDECDAIFGKRTEVKDAHDRYANTEVNYLLQRLEQYDGIVLLATNFQKNIDEAFLRRLQDSIDFPFPDEAAREQIWRRQFPSLAPVDAQLDYAALAAQFKLAGGNIRNAATYAAYRAAEQGGRNAVIRMPHVLEGVRREFQKQGKLVAANEPAPPRAIRA